MGKNRFSFSVAKQDGVIVLAFQGYFTPESQEELKDLADYLFPKVEKGIVIDLKECNPVNSSIVSLVLPFVVGIGSDTGKRAVFTGLDGVKKKVLTIANALPMALVGNTVDDGIAIVKEMSSLED